MNWFSEEAVEKWREELEPEPKFLLTRQGIKDITTKYRRPSMEGLMLHCGAERISREALREITTPVPTRTWRPVPHYEAAMLIADNAERRGYVVRREEYGVTLNGNKMFGVMKFAPEGMPEHTRALGIRNSHDKTLCLSLTVGVSVVVCDNLAFGGTTVISRKHTSGIVVEELLGGAFDRLGEEYARLDARIAEMKAEAVSDDCARLDIVRAAEAGAVPSCDILAVLKEYRAPRHAEFAPRTRWSLYNSFTETAKKYTPARADLCYRRLGRVFGME